MCESDSCANVSNLRAVGWSTVPLQLLVLLQTAKALGLGRLLLDLLADCFQCLWVQLVIQGPHLTRRAGGTRSTPGQSLHPSGRRLLG